MGLSKRSSQSMQRRKEKRNASGRKTVPPGSLDEQVQYCSEHNSPPCWDMREKPEMWPNPTTQEIEHPNAELTDTGRRKSKDGKSSHSLNLADQVNMWPTPRVSDTEGGVVKNVEKKNDSYSRVNKKGVRFGVKLKDAVGYEEDRTWPTPSTRDYKGGHGTIVEEDGKYYRVSNTTGTKYGARLDAQVEKMEEEKLWPTPIASSSQSASMDASKKEAERLHPKGQNHLAAEMASRLWETPTAGMGKVDTANLEYHKRRKSLGKQVGLPGQVQLEEATWPTPTVQDSNKATKKWRDKHQNNLTAAVFNPEQILPTPTSRDWKGGYRTESLIRNDGKSRAMDQLPNAAIGGVGTEKVVGHLNPDWVEWLMGYAPGYTDPEYTEPMHLEDHLGFESEPDIPRVTTRKEHRVNRLKCLGNSIVPQIMHEIGKAILKDKEAEGVK